MWTLSRLLPLIIGYDIPEDNLYWENFLLLLTIMDYILALVISPDDIAFLYLLIKNHHLDFKILYPNFSITLKFHYMIHYPEYISRYIIHT